MPSYLTKSHKQKAKMIAPRLRAFANASLGKSDLRIGPNSIAALMNDAAKLFEQMTSERQTKAGKTDAAYVSTHPGKHFVRHAGILVRRPFDTEAEAQGWARENYQTAAWAIEPSAAH